MKITEINTYEELLELKDCWENLYHNHGKGNIFISWHWCTLWWKHFGHGNELCVLKVCQDDSVLAIIPLMVSRGGINVFRRPVIKFIADEMMADYMDVLIADKHSIVIDKTFEYLSKKKCAAIELLRFREFSPNLQPILDHLKRNNKIYISDCICKSPYINIQDRWDSYYKSLSKSLRQDIRTTINKLNRAGGYSFRICKGSEITKDFDDLVKLHIKRQHNKAGNSIFQNPVNIDFLKEIVSEFEISGNAQLSLIEHDQKNISAVLALSSGTDFYYWIPTFDMDYNNFSLGKLHIYHILQTAVENNFENFDFMIGDESYKYRWTSQEFSCYSIKIYSSRIYQLIDKTWHKLRYLLKTVKNKSKFLSALWIRISKNRFLEKT